MTYFLGIEVLQNDHCNFICQVKYAKQVLKKFSMEGCKNINTILVVNEKSAKENEATK